MSTVAVNPGEPLRVAIVSFAHVHAANYAAQLVGMTGVEVRGSDPDAASAPVGELRGAAWAERHGIDYLGELDELFAWRPHAVIIASENSRHRAFVERAAAAGAHILCEKPLATSRADAEVMVAACEAADVILMMAYPTRFTRSAAHLAELVANDQLGTIIAASGNNNSSLPMERAWFTDPELAGGGALVDHIVHIADLLEFAVGQRPVRVHASVNRILNADRVPVGVETGGLVSIEYDGGLIATIDCSWSHPASAPGWGGLALELVGSKGVASIAPYAQKLSGFSERAGAALDLPYGDDAYRAMLDEFLAAVAEGRRPLPDASVGIRTLDIVLAAQESVRTGPPVQL